MTMGRHILASEGMKPDATAQCYPELPNIFAPPRCVILRAQRASVWQKFCMAHPELMRWRRYAHVEGTVTMP